VTAYPPHNPSDICPKCASPGYRTFYHSYLQQSDQGLFPDAPNPCWEVEGFPKDEGGEELENEDLDTEEHLHRQCPRCGYERIEALVGKPSTGEDPAPRFDYRIVTRMTSKQSSPTNEARNASAEGWRAIALYRDSMGEVHILMEKPL